MASATGDAKSTYLANKVLDHVLGATAYTAPATVYLALFTAAPNDGGGGTEVSGGSYARVSITNNTTNFPNASSGSKNLATTQTFPTATAGWGTVLAVALFDASTSGNLLYWTTITSQVVNSGSAPSFAANALTFSET